jgi:hypothetical protein
MARQREVSEDGTSLVSEPESLMKTHLTSGGKGENGPPWGKYSADWGADSMGFMN